ncbi:MAG TPA: site-specific DNA-methyltransferase [Chloroflexi bacterium]|nr:site-specific DNA-methyltransferase [Chloroflexota bacterium]|tara:strand:+ start:1816 stop:2679 length:864 start_codon:yes stop_codon:yes gene_type:complete
MGKIIYGDNLPILQQWQENTIDLIYIDPPFNTGKRQEKHTTKTSIDPKKGDRTGFKGKRYKTVHIETTGYNDKFDNFIDFISSRANEAYRILKDNGSLFFHIDYREAHYCKVLLDEIFGRNSFINEIIWAYDYGGRTKSRWPAKHDTILWYAKNHKSYTFNYEEMDRIPYMAPGLVGTKKANKGKTPTDVWWHTIVSPTGKEKTGYATQKPLGIIKRIIKIHSNPNDTVMDFFAGSGTTGEASALLNRNYILIDNNPEALLIMKKRLQNYNPTIINSEDTNTLPSIR